MRICAIVRSRSVITCSSRSARAASSNRTDAPLPPAASIVWIDMPIANSRWITWSCRSRAILWRSESTSRSRATCCCSA
ncbi:Uncharacterised protein [Mycobacteroides abscessus subsp. abscessus]|nr:Uncharacterised protein [Mycobacteroides abscessus subsp. abscessus]